MDFFQITAPQNQQKNLDPPEPNTLFLGTPRKQDYTGQAYLRNLSYLEEPLEASEGQGVLNYTKKLATHVTDHALTLLGFAYDTEAPYLVLGKDLERIRISTDAAYGRMGQDKDMQWEHGKVWGSKRNAEELA